MTSDIKIFSPSYRRSNNCVIHKYLSQVNYVVAESEKSKYKDVHEKIIAIPDNEQGSYPKVCNWILRNGGDKIVIIDDDMKSINRWTKRVSKKLNEKQVYDFLVKGFLIAKEIGVHYWGMNINKDKQLYREYIPFSLTSYLGGPFQAFYKNDLLFDERMLLKEDYDMTLQQLNKYRKVFRFNMFYFDCKQAEQEGGCATYRNFDTEMDQLKLLQKKWGSDIVRIDKADRSHNLKKKKSKIDFNPIIKAPIKGI